MANIITFNGSSDYVIDLNKFDAEETEFFFTGKNFSGTILSTINVKIIQNPEKQFSQVNINLPEIKSLNYRNVTFNFDYFDFGQRISFIPASGNFINGYEGIKINCLPFVVLSATSSSPTNWQIDELTNGIQQ